MVQQNIVSLFLIQIQYLFRGDLLFDAVFFADEVTLIINRRIENMIVIDILNDLIGRIDAV